jgi:hypothetical protein
MKNINRRESPRIDIRLSCRVTSPALGMSGAMETENISRGGVLIAWGEAGGGLEPPALGQLVAVEIELPAFHSFGRKCMHCEGSVMRVSLPESGRPRVALRVNYMDFRSLHEASAPVEAESFAGLWMA